MRGNKKAVRGGTSSYALMQWRPKALFDEREQEGYTLRHLLLRHYAVERRYQGRLSMRGNKKAVRGGTSSYTPMQWRPKALFDEREQEDGTWRPLILRSYAVETKGTSTLMRWNKNAVNAGTSSCSLMQ
ncbi:hypothetical protein NDU88_000382 [Pleurodeles waltl]|uniref:Uncharacterized protein n=1 Tax=Pleurodeles waltl TaxID=8319 RepID=A0AAV7Q769_PLEWA|nr:hypothetical protein NDU88_000382 [Pleurodeles waltl]